METTSYRDNFDSVPLGRAAMEWFFRHAFGGKVPTNNPRIELSSRKDLTGPPPTLLITADLDPLRSEGQLLAEHLKKANVAIKSFNIARVGHEFFSMNKVVFGATLALERVLEALDNWG